MVHGFDLLLTLNDHDGVEKSHLGCLGAVLALPVFLHKFLQSFLGHKTLEYLALSTGRFSFVAVDAVISTECCRN
jgi:hypothetical protein